MVGVQSVGGPDRNVKLLLIISDIVQFISPASNHENCLTRYSRRGHGCQATKKVGDEEVLSSPSHTLCPYTLPLPTIFASSPSENLHCHVM
ncbi:hypothetical protein NL676_030335 [Syzygium grande]|nr:hypothetical protein NL676_030335 [Syzygium grande]